MVIIEWRGMNTYQELMYSINGDSFSCYQFYLDYFAGRMYSEVWVMC